MFTTLLFVARLIGQAHDAWRAAFARRRPAESS